MLRAFVGVLLVLLVFAGSPRAEDASEYEAYCGGPKQLSQCLQVINDTSKLVREIQSSPGGKTANIGIALTGCAYHCQLKYFPSQTPQECRASVDLFKLLAKGTPQLRTSMVQRNLSADCGKF